MNSAFKNGFTSTCCDRKGTTQPETRPNVRFFRPLTTFDSQASIEKTFSGGVADQIAPQRRYCPKRRPVSAKLLKSIRAASIPNRTCTTMNTDCSDALPVIPCGDGKRTARHSRRFASVGPMTELASLAFSVLPIGWIRRRWQAGADLGGGGLGVKQTIRWFSLRAFGGFNHHDCYPSIGFLGIQENTSSFHNVRPCSWTNCPEIEPCAPGSDRTGSCADFAILDRIPMPDASLWIVNDECRS